METLALSDVPEELKAAEPMRNVYEMAAASLDDNCIKGAAAVMGNMDRNGRVIFPGFFGSALKRFTTDGFVAIAHNQDDLPIAMPMVAREEGSSLYTEAVFHSTQRAQDARTVAKERMDAKKTVGLSVGWLPDYTIGDDGEYVGVRYFETGKALLAYAESLGCDMDLFDKRSIRAHSGYCRGMMPGGCADLFEYSIVTVPSNRRAMATQVAAAGRLVLGGFNAAECVTERAFDEFLRDAGFSKKQATAITIHGFKASLQRDAEADTAEEAQTEDPAEEPPVEPVQTPPTVDLAHMERLHSLRLREARLREFALSLTPA